MAVSGTTTFTVQRDDILKAAMRKLSVLEDGATPTTDQITNFAFTLNLILKNLQTKGIKLWTYETITVPLTASKTTYTIGPTSFTPDVVTDSKPLKVIQAWLLNTSVTPNTRIPMQILSNQEYNWLGSPASTGVTNSIMYMPGVNTGTLSVFLTPDSATATNYSLQLIIQRQIYDVNLSTENLDLPAEWFYPLMWAIVADQASDNDKSIQDRAYYDAKAAALLSDIESWDIETASTKFIPDMRMRS